MHVASPLTHATRVWIRVRRTFEPNYFRSAGCPEVNHDLCGSRQGTHIKMPEHMVSQGLNPARFRHTIEIKHHWLQTAKNLATRVLSSQGYIFTVHPWVRT